MTKKLFKTIIISILSLNAHAQVKYMKTDPFMNADKLVHQSSLINLENYSFIDYDSGKKFDPILNIKKSRGIRLALSIMNDSLESIRLINNGPNIINVMGGVVIIEYNHTTGYWEVDYKKHWEATGDQTRPTRFFTKNRIVKKVTRRRRKKTIV